MIGDKLRRALVRLIGHETARFDYFAHYAGRVLDQSADLETVYLRPDASKFQAIWVPLRLGLPGVKVKLAKGAGGARVMLGHDNGDPARPYAALFEAGGLDELVITATTKVTVSAPSVVLADGARPVACVGDIVQVNGIAPAGIVLLAPSGGGPVTGTILLTGQITQGQNQVKAP